METVEHVEFVDVEREMGMCWYGALCTVVSPDPERAWVEVGGLDGVGGVLVRPLKSGAGIRSAMSGVGSGSGGKGRGGACVLECRRWESVLRSWRGLEVLKSGGGERLGGGREVVYAS